MWKRDLRSSSERLQSRGAEGRGAEGQQMILKVTEGLERAQLAQCSHSSMQPRVQVSSTYVKGGVVIHVCSFSTESRDRRLSEV